MTFSTRLAPTVQPASNQSLSWHPPGQTGTVLHRAASVPPVANPSLSWHPPGQPAIVLYRAATFQPTSNPSLSWHPPGQTGTVPHRATSVPPVPNPSPSWHPPGQTGTVPHRATVPHRSTFPLQANVSQRASVFTAQQKVVDRKTPGSPVISTPVFQGKSITFSDQFFSETDKLQKSDDQSHLDIAKKSMSTMNEFVEQLTQQLHDRTDELDKCKSKLKACFEMLNDLNELNTILSNQVNKLKSTIDNLNLQLAQVTQENDRLSSIMVNGIKKELSVTKHPPLVLTKLVRLHEPEGKFNDKYLRELKESVLRIQKFEEMITQLHSDITTELDRFKLEFDKGKFNDKYLRELKEPMLRMQEFEGIITQLHSDITTEFDKCELKLKAYSKELGRTEKFKKRLESEVSELTEKSAELREKLDQATQENRRLRSIVRPQAIKSPIVRSSTQNTASRSVSKKEQDEISRRLIKGEPSHSTRTRGAGSVPETVAENRQRSQGRGASLRLPTRAWR